MQNCKQLALLRSCSWRMVHSHKHLVELSEISPPHRKIPIGIARELCVKHLFGAKDVNHFTARSSEYTFLLFRSGLTLGDFYRITDEFMEDVICTLSSTPHYCSISPCMARIYMASAALVWDEPIVCNAPTKEASESAWEAFEGAFKRRLLPAVTKGVA